jgi:hypothetical protein
MCDVCPPRNLTKISNLRFFANDLTFSTFGNSIPMQVDALLWSLALAPTD